MNKQKQHLKSNPNADKDIFFIYLDVNKCSKPATGV
ncbi:hypothetical protein HNR74_002326 [Flammeovirga kamogawensis]|nr:hypothetical protein [Flammeovirga kamogawensis]